MSLRHLIALLAFISCFAVASETTQPLERDREAIRAMAGTFVVDFHFKETVAFEPGYDLKDAYDAAALEEVIIIEDTPRKIVLQHILLTKRGIIKHWRQDWEYENREIWEYQGERTWRKQTLSADESRGTWTQRVFQVDDSPRYESVGRWVHDGNLSEWTSAKTNRPLPRREYTKRDDYDVLVAINRHALTPTGWIHEQDNVKLRTRDQNNHRIAREFGLNRYDHANPKKTEEIREWWAANQPFWADVRKAWNNRFANLSVITLEASVDDKPLYRHMFSMGKNAVEEKTYDSTSYRNKIAETINAFLTEPPMEKASRDTQY